MKRMISRKITSASPRRSMLLVVMQLTLNRKREKTVMSTPYCTMNTSLSKTRKVNLYLIRKTRSQMTMGPQMKYLASGLIMFDTTAIATTDAILKLLKKSHHFLQLFSSSLCAHLQPISYTNIHTNRIAAIPIAQSKVASVRLNLEDCRLRIMLTVAQQASGTMNHRMSPFQKLQNFWQRTFFLVQARMPRRMSMRNVTPNQLIPGEMRQPQVQRNSPLLQQEFMKVGMKEIKPHCRFSENAPDVLANTSAKTQNI